MEELDKLQYLSLVSKVCTELENHLGFNDKDMAEFIIQLADENSTFDSFKMALINNQAQFTDSFIANLLRIIQHMRPNKNKNLETNIGKNKSNKDDKELKRALYPCLALPDKEFEKENIEDIQDTEDTMKLFEQLSKENTKLENEKTSKQNTDNDSTNRHKSKHKSSKDSSRRDRSHSPQKSSKHHHRDSSRHNHKSRRYCWQINCKFIFNKILLLGQEVGHVLRQEIIVHIIKILDDKNMKNYLRHQLLEQY